MRVVTSCHNVKHLYRNFIYLGLGIKLVFSRLGLKSHLIRSVVEMGVVYGFVCGNS
jgi:hypothetical protein